MRLLQAHHIAAPVGQVLVPAGNALVSEAIRLNVEVAAIFDAATGRAFAPYRTGTTDAVDLSGQLAALASGTRYVAIHTHRESTAFSDDDLALLLANDAVRTIAAIGVDGTCHLLSKVAGRAQPAKETGVTAFQRALSRLMGPMRARARAEEIAPAEATRDALHRIWGIMAPVLGLRYDRSR